jgi:hypothetical protein
VFNGEFIEIAWFQYRDVKGVTPFAFYNQYNKPLDITHWMTMPSIPTMFEPNENQNYEQYV